MVKKKGSISLLFKLSIVGLLLFLPIFIFSTQTSQDIRQEAASSCSTTFTDINPSSSFGKMLSCIGKQACIVRGYGDSSFNPSATIPRSEAVALIVRLQVEVLGNWEYKTPSTPSFSDIPTSYTHFKEIETAKFYRFIFGTTYGAFEPATEWRYGFHGVWRSTPPNSNTFDKNNVDHPDECWGGSCYNFTGSANEQMSRESFVTKLFTYGLEKGNLTSCPEPTATPKPTNTPIPTATPKPTNTPIPVLATATPIPPSPVDPDCLETDLGCIPSHPLRFTEQVYIWGLGLLSGIALLFIMYGGYLIMTSQGNPTRLENGRKYIYYAIGAMILGTMGFVLLEIIAKDLLQIPGFT